MACEGDDELGLSLNLQSPSPSGADAFHQSAVIASSREGERKKLRLSKEQAAVLEETFREQNSVNQRQKMALAKQLNLRPRQVEQGQGPSLNKRKLSVSICGRLQKEVNELRALKLYANMTPPTTLSICPQCERLSSGKCRILYL